MKMRYGITCVIAPLNLLFLNIFNYFIIFNIVIIFKVRICIRTKVNNNLKSPTKTLSLTKNSKPSRKNHGS